MDIEIGSNIFHFNQITPKLSASDKLFVDQTVRKYSKGSFPYLLGEFFKSVIQDSDWDKARSILVVACRSSLGEQKYPHINKLADKILQQEVENLKLHKTEEISKEILKPLPESNVEYLKPLIHFETQEKLKEHLLKLRKEGSPLLPWDDATLNRLQTNLPLFSLSKTPEYLPLMDTIGATVLSEFRKLPTTHQKLLMALALYLNKESTKPSVSASDLALTFAPLLFPVNQIEQSDINHKISIVANFLEYVIKYPEWLQEAS